MMAKSPAARVSTNRSMRWFLKARGHRAPKAEGSRPLSTVDTTYLIAEVVFCVVDPVAESPLDFIESGCRA